MRILIVSQWCQPEPFFKVIPFAKELMRLGHEVQVLTGFPNYPGGRLYPGYRVRLFQRELIEGVSVIRTPLYPSHDKSPMRRIANYISFALSSSVLGPVLSRPADVMYVYHPPPTVGLTALVLRLFRKTPFVYDMQDLWPDSLNATGMLTNGFALRLVDRWCRFLYRRANRIVVLSPGFKDVLVTRGVPAGKVEVIYNWCDEARIQSSGGSEAQAVEPGFSGRFNIVFAGTMGKAQALDSVLEAAALVSMRAPAIRFVFVGGGIDVERLRRKSEDMRLENTLFLPRRPVSEMAGLLNSADLFLVHLRDDPLFRIAIPSKVQAYMAAGRPILLGARGDAVKLVERAGAGYSCSPEDPQSIAEAAVKFYEMPSEELQRMGRNGRRFYENELSMRAGVRRFEEVFESVIEASRR